MATYLGCLSSVTDATEGPGHLDARRYFTMQKDLAPGTEVGFTTCLAGGDYPRNRSFRSRAPVRVDKQEEDTPETIGVAAVIERYDMIRGEVSQI